MFIIVGLGNPTSTYAGTRHNIGFDVVDYIAEQNQININQKKHKALIGKGSIGGEQVVLVKPQTYMNLSGESVQDIISFYKIDPSQNLIVIYDDISLDVGAMRLRAKGSAGGHNGIKSIIQCTGTDSFYRIKFGVGNKPNGWDLADYVLGRFDQVDRTIVEEGIEISAKAVETIMSKGLNEAMNHYNGSYHK